MISLFQNDRCTILLWSLLTRLLVTLEGITIDSTMNQQPRRSDGIGYF